jgi:uncharacterized OB-fold protein
MTDTPALPAPDPDINPETVEFWRATTEGRLLLSHCPDCDTYIWYPRAICSACHHSGTEWVEATGRGQVYSFAVTRRGQGDYRDAAPYVLAYVELEEGPRLLTNIVETDPGTVTVGQAVEVVFHPTRVDAALPRFRPVPD